MSEVALDAPLVIDIDRPIRLGLLYALIGFFGFFLWAAFAPLRSAAVAPGVVVADSRNKTIQHLEGGIIDEVFVREGDHVSSGQVLARLDGVTAKASLGRLRATRMAALAEEARLIAERDGLDHVVFPKEFANTKDPETVEAVKGQQALFIAHRVSQASEIEILQQRIAQYGEEIKGVEAQVASEDRQLELVEEELKDVRGLVKKGLERKPRLLALERSAADISGQRGEHVAQIARSRQSIGEMQERLVNSKAKYLDDAVSKLREAQTKLADVRQQILAASDTSRRLDVLAPVGGKVVSIFRQSPGSVVKPGETIMEVLPDEDLLIIEAQVKPEDIDVVALNQPARVRLTAYSYRRTSSLKGRVIEVSADRIVDQKGEKAHYLARLAVDTSELAAQPGLELYPGMPAVAFIETGRESLLDYLLTPLFGGIERGMREQ